MAVRTIEEAGAFLSYIKNRISTDGILFMNGRMKNVQCLANLGITPAIQRGIINGLVAEDYCSGPDRDDKFQWKDVGVFGSNYNGIELYIKFSIGAAGAPVVCLSFHESGHPMRYQFK